MKPSRGNQPSTPSQTNITRALLAGDSPVMLQTFKEFLAGDYRCPAFRTARDGGLPRESTTALRQCKEEAATTKRSSTLHTPVLPRLPEKILRLLNAAYAAHGGAERMSLGEWHNVEEELKNRLQHEYQEHQE